MCLSLFINVAGQVVAPVKKKNYMKSIILVILLLITGVAGSQNVEPKDLFTTDFNRVADAYEKAIEPYLLKFSELQMEPAPPNLSSEATIARQRAVLSMVRIHKMYAKNFREESYEIKLKSDALNYKGDISKIVSYFDFGYKTQFLFLDYKFYEEVNKQFQQPKK
jgi:hypothetical protein